MPSQYIYKRKLQRPAILVTMYGNSFAYKRYPITNSNLLPSIRPSEKLDISDVQYGSNFDTTSNWTSYILHFKLSKLLYFYNGKYRESIQPSNNLKRLFLTCLRTSLKRRESNSIIQFSRQKKHYIKEQVSLHFIIWVGTFLFKYCIVLGEVKIDNDTCFLNKCIVHIFK